MVWRATDSATYHEIVSFWNPRIKRRQVFLRDRITKRFIRGLREIYVVVIVTFESVTHSDWSKNVKVEVVSVAEVTRDDWRLIERDEDFETLINDKAAEAEEVAVQAISGFGGGEIAGVAYFSEPVESYIKLSRVTLDRAVVKVTYYTLNWHRISRPVFRVV